MFNGLMQTFRKQGLRFLRSRSNSKGQNADGQGGTSTDFAQGREDDRHAHMSAEDRAWEVASLQRNRDAQERQQP